MGIFDIFKSEKKEIGTMNCLATAGKWDTGYKQDTKGLVKFIKKKIKDGTLKKELDYKFVDTKVNETINQVKTPQGIFYIARNLINHKDIDIVKAFKITKDELIIFNVCNNQNYWSKKIDYDGEIRTLTFQFIELDKDEYKLLKPFEKKIMKKSEKLIDTYLDLREVIFNGLFATKKRKEYPINRFMTFVGFEEV